MSEWFASTGDEIGGKHGIVSEVLCELPPKPTQRVAEVLQGKQPNAAYKQISIHEDDLRTFPALFVGEDIISRQRRLLALRTTAAKLERAIESFGRDRDCDDFQHLWDHFLAPHSPERLLGPRSTLHHGDVASFAADVAIPTQPHSEPSSVPSSTSCAIPTLLLSTNGASMADRIDLYGAFATYLRTQQDAYVALLRPEDLAGGVGSCFSSALAQLSGLPEAAAEDVMGLVAWYDHETGISGSHLSNSEGDAAITAARSPNNAAAKTPAKRPKTPRKAPVKTPAKGPAKTPSKATRGTQEQRKENAEDVMEAQDVEAQEAPGTVAARLRARRGQAGEAAAAAAEAETRKAHEAAATVAARNRRRHVVLLVESASRVCDRGALRALLAALHGERHRLPVVLVLGLSCPAALYDSKLPADIAALLQMTAAELAPHPLQLHRLFQDVLLAPAAPSAVAMLLDGATMRELLVQCRLLEPSLASLQTALLEAHEQHFRCEPLAPLALLPFTEHTQQQQKGAAAAAVGTASRSLAANGATPGRRRLHAGPIKAKAAGADSSDEEDAADDTSSGTSSHRSVASREVENTADTCGAGASNHGGGGSQDGLVLDEAWLAQRRQQHMARLSAAVLELPEDFIRAAAAAAAGGAESAGATGALRQRQQQGDLAAAAAGAMEAVAAAFSTLSSWRLGLQWFAALAERTGALQQPGGQRYSLPALYVAAASPRFWRPAPSAAAAAAMLTAAARGAAADPELPPSVGELLLGALLGGAAAGAGGSRATLRNMSDQAVYRLLDELWELASEALRLGWMPSPEAMAAAQGLQELRARIAQSPAAGDAPGGTAAPAVVAAGATGGGGGADDQVSPLRQRLAAQGLTSPPTHKKLESITERLGRLDPLPAPKILQPNDAPPQEQQQPPQPAVGGPATRRKGAVVAGGIKLPSSGQTQTKSQRDKALKTVIQQRAAAGPASQPAADHAAAISAGAAARSAADMAADFLATTLRQLLGTCPFQLPGSSAFTFRDAAGLQRRLVGAPSLALHTYLTQPELVLTDLQPGLHPGQEDAALAYQLLVGCREGVSLQDWLADYCAASGLGRMQEVQQEEPEQDGDGEAEQDRPMGRSRHSQRRQAPRKRKAAPKQEVVLALDGPEAEAAVDALAARFEQAARELEAVGLCRFSKRRAGLYVHRTYFPPEAVA